MSEGKPEEGRDRGKSRDDQAGRPADRTNPRGSGLTERQRREARELRRKRDRSASGRRKGRAAPAKGSFSAGARATAGEARRAVVFIGRGVRTAVGGLLSMILIGAGAVLTAAAAVLGLIGGALASVGRTAGQAALALDRVLTPARAVVAVSALAGLLLLVSQFLDYRAIEIGASGYDPILDLTRAPRTDAETPTGAHSIVLVIAAIVALGCCAAVVWTGRRSFALGVAAVGLLALAVGLVVDLPKGLDSAAASAAYADARAILLPGFWLQIASGAVLIAGGAIMAFGSASAPSRATSRDRREADRRRRRATAGGAA